MLELTSSGVEISQPDGTRVTVASAKWITYLSLLVTRPEVTFDQLFQVPEFREGRKGLKSARTVAVEIDNFRRQVQKSGLIIDKIRSGSEINYVLRACPLSDEKCAAFERHLDTRPRYGEDLLGMVTAPLSGHLHWLFRTMRAKVAFANGQVSEALRCHQAALDGIKDALLNAATYAEIARITYRADRDLLIDMRDAAMSFAQTENDAGLIQKIYQPRIRTAYAFQDDRPDEELNAELGTIISGYVSDGIDVAGLARSLNTHGGALRRIDCDEAAIPALQLASVFAVTINDADLIQASLFNLLASLEFSALVGSELKTEASETNYWFCENMNVGKDTAQCSLLASQFYLEHGDLKQAEEAIRRSARLMAGERNATDMAYFFYCRARIGLATASPELMATRHAIARARLERADRLYRKLGNVFGIRKAARLRKMLNVDARRERP